jgi:transcriptional regulator with GAF, ATPase, and Fis domain
MDTPPAQAKVLSLFLNILLSLQNLERGSIWVRRTDGYECILSMGEQSESDSIAGVLISNAYPSIVGWVIEHGQMTMGKANEDRRHYGRIERTLNIKSNLILCFPLLLQSGEVYGAVELIDTSPDADAAHLKESDLDLIQNIITVGALALSKDLAYCRQKEENHQLKRLLGTDLAAGGIIGRSAAITAAVDKIGVYARADYPVLIQGESGTGKELFAAALHRSSDRGEGPYLVQNCSAIPETLLESELFGHRKGAFTGAVKDKVGLLETADGGTVFLDEIGDMPLALQAKILRFLDQGEIKPVGAARSRQINVRVVAATHVDLPRAVEAGRFREDLYYRLNVLPLTIPPLRERREDIPLLLERFVAMEADALGIPPKTFDRRALDTLTRQQWKGNVRELKNMVRHLMVVTGGKVISEAALPSHFFGISPAPTAGPPPERPDHAESASPTPVPLARYAWHELERDYMLALLENSRWNISRAARMAGLNRSTFNSRLRRLGIKKSA